ncbi:MAG: TIGR04255 family protein [Chloroflexi bacterium]|nr:TIGR04255 family protein [Chloroflexota bacterium]
MGGRVLRNKPLVEAVFELHWALQEQPSGGKVDPYSKILVGRVYDLVKDEYRFHEQLPAASMPDELINFVPQHRFRVGKDQWPLIQIGPGVLSVNDTETYGWEDFSTRISSAVNVLCQTYPDREALRFTELQLRYIDSIPFDYDENNVLDFLRRKMKLVVELSPSLFQNTGVENKPLATSFGFVFPTSAPEGVIEFRIRSGSRGDETALIWETQIRVQGEGVPENENGIDAWASAAHELSSGWFFKIIEGELLKEFE